MVDVTRNNFDDLFPEIVEKIHRATFVALDAEYTGIFSEDLKDSNTLFDSAPQRYLKTRENMSRFTASQIGVAIFEKNRNSNVYYAETYNFYLFPVAFDSFAKRDSIHCQISCLNFLTRHNFDFNKFIRDGVPYLNDEKAHSLKIYLNTNRHFMSTAEHLDKSYFPVKHQIMTDADIYEVLDRLAGFSKVIDVLHKAKKPIIGHNFFTDLLLIHQLFWCDLPESYEKFKLSMYNLFPVVYDTKYLCRELQQIRREKNRDDFLLSDSNLFALYTNTYSVFELNMPLLEPRGESQNYYQVLLEGRKQNLETLPNASQHCHSAGFDALVTGCVFLNLAYIAARPLCVPDYEKGLPPTFTELLGKTEIWMNKVNIARAIIPHINLDGVDPPSHRPNLIIVKYRDGHYIDPLRLRLELIKYGDVEVLGSENGELTIACGAFSCYRRVWKDLGTRGYPIVEKSYECETPFSFNWKKCLLFGIFGSGILYFVAKRFK